MLRMRLVFRANMKFKLQMFEFEISFAKLGQSDRLKFSFVSSIVEIDPRE